MAVAHRSRLVPLLLAGCLLVPACRRAGPPAQVVVLINGEPLTLDPHLHREVITRSVLANIYEGLVGFDRRMAIEPLLAERWENPDEKTWIFRLRPGVTFPNGRKMTAEDVVYSLTRALQHPQSQVKSMLEGVLRVVAVNGATVRIETTQPIPVLLNRLTKVAIVAVRGLTRIPARPDVSAPLGTGPYLCTAWDRRRGMVLERRDGYWGRQPSIQRMVFRAMADNSRAIALLKEGTADLVAAITPEGAKGLVEGDSVRIIRRVGLPVRYLKLDPTLPPFSSPLLRRAVSLALDREQLVEVAAHGFGRPANQMVTPAVFGYNSDLPPLRRDLDRAKELLGEAGFQHGLAVELDVIDVRAHIGEVIKEQLAEAGIQVTILAHDKKTFFEGTGRKSYFFMSAVASNSGDASDLFDSTTDVSSEDAVALGSTNPLTRLDVLKRLLGRMTEECVFVPLYAEDEIYAVSPRLRWEARQDMMLLGKEMDRS